MIARGARPFAHAHELTGDLALAQRGAVEQL